MGIDNYTYIGAYLTYKNKKAKSVTIVTIKGCPSSKCSQYGKGQTEGSFCKQCGTKLGKYDIERVEKNATIYLNDLEDKYDIDLDMYMTPEWCNDKDGEQTVFFDDNKDCGRTLDEDSDKKISLEGVNMDDFKDKFIKRSVNLIKALDEEKISYKIHVGAFVYSY